MFFASIFDVGRLRSQYVIGRVSSVLQSYPALLFGATLLSLSGCVATTFTSTWKSPNAKAFNPAGKTIAAVFVSDNDAYRRTAEDALAKDLNARGTHGVPAYTLLSSERDGTAEDDRARLKKAGANEIVVLQVVGADKRPYTQVFGATSSTSHTPGSANTQAVSEQQHYDTLVSVETTVYSLDRNELIWSGTSRTTNPEDLANLVNEVADATVKEMVKQGLLARQ
jgi:hypothetical protein